MVEIERLEQELDQLLKEAEEALAQTAAPEALEELRVRYLGRRGRLNDYFKLMRQEGLSAQDKGQLGSRLNAAKQRLEQLLEERGRALGPAKPSSVLDPDLTLPGYSPPRGGLHPLTRTIEEILFLFGALGFSAVEGPEVVTEFENFEALNIPADHPSRESFDTFYLKEERPSGSRYLLRSHTSPMQVRFMQNHTPPLQIVVPGRVFRRDAVDPSHCFQFHQVEGLAVGPGLNFGDLKGVLTAWARGTFGPEARLRFRPHYFPFTEPSAEADLACVFCGGKGCRVCGQKGWLEILGCGMVHPEVFKAVGYPVGTIGFAFGMGVERIAMLRFGIEDIRLFFENDLRFLRQFP